MKTFCRKSSGSRGAAWFARGVVSALMLAALSACGPERPKVAPEPPPETHIPYATLKQALESQVWSDRSTAVLEVGRHGYREAVPILFKLIEKDPHPAVRRTCALVLADFGEKRVAPIITRMLKSDQAAGPGFLMDALSRVGDASHGAAVVPFLDADTDALRLQAVSTLETLKARGQGGLILARARANRDPDKAKTYAMVLGKLEVQAADGYLRGLALSLEPGPPLAAAYLALGRIKSRAAVDTLVQALGKDFDTGRRNASIALVMIGDVRAVAKSFPYLENQVDDVRWSAAKVIAGIPAAASTSGPRALELLKKRDAKTLGPAAFILGRLKHKAARPAIEEILGDEESPEREALAQSLGWIGEKASVPLLIKVLAEKKGEGRYGAAWSLGIMTPPEALDPLLAAAESSDRKLRNLALEAVGAYRSEKTLSVLEAAIGDPASTLFAVEAVRQVPGERARLILEKRALGGTDVIRRAAVAALGKRKEVESVPALIAVLKGPNENRIHATAYGALFAVTGIRFRGPAEAEAWWAKRSAVKEN